MGATRSKQDIQPAKPRSERLRLLLLAGAITTAVAIFVGGAYFGRWAVLNHARPRLQAAFWSALSNYIELRNVNLRGESQKKNTHLVRIETSVINLPDDTGWGGGIQPMEGGQIFYASREGTFGIIGADGIAHALPFKIGMNLDDLKRHPVYKLTSFNHNWFRVTDILLDAMGAGRYELLVGHHHFDSQRQCVELWLSRAVLATAGSSLELTEPFRTVFITNPCITFNGAENTNTFEGHFSGGRIARLKGDEILFSTGDHGWVGLDGHPALSQDDSSTLGKILLVNTSTNKVSIYAKGVRNPQGLTVDSQGRIWETEHGPRGGDELNLIVEGGNYGWPDSTYGTDYGPLPWPLNVEQGRHQMGIAPQFAWSPSIAPSNLVESKGAEFPLWRGDLLVASLGGSAIHRLHLEGTRVAYDEPIPFEGVRIRDIIEMPGGSLALLTDDRTVILVRNADAKNNSPFLDVARQKQRTRDMSNEERAKAVAGRYAKSAIAAVQDESPMFEPAVRGANVFQRNCAVCHSISSLAAGTGPSLKGVVGRRVGSTTFAYSHVLTGHSDIWTSRRIVDFAVKTQHMYPGTVMSPVQLSGTDQADLATYLDVAGR